MVLIFSLIQTCQCNEVVSRYTRHVPCLIRDSISSLSPQLMGFIPSNLRSLKRKITNFICLLPNNIIPLSDTVYSR